MTAYLGNVDSDRRLPSADLRPHRSYKLDAFAHYPEHFNSTDMLLDAQLAKGRGDHPALLYRDQRITYRELARDVDRLGSELQQLGVRPGDRVLLRSLNEPAAIVANFAALKIGAVVVPTSPLYDADRLAGILHDCEPAAIVVCGALLDAVLVAIGHVGASTHVIVFDATQEQIETAAGLDYDDLLAAGDDRLDPVLRPRSAVALLFYTSGIDRPPTALAHLQEEMLIIPDVFGRYAWDIQPADVLAGAGPMSFAGGYSAVATLAYRRGATTAIIPMGTPASALFDVIRKHKITLLAAMPTTYQQMADVADADPADLTSLRIVSGGGDCLSSSTLTAWHERFKLDIFEGFGTNGMMHVFLTNAITKTALPGAIGPPLPGYEVSVLTADRQPVPTGEVGQLYVRGPLGTLHWGHPDHALEVAARQAATTHQGWTRIGDWVTLDADGAVRFIAREDELFVRGTDRFGPRDVELPLAAHPNVIEAGVFRSAEPAESGDMHALVVLTAEQPDIDDVLGRLAAEAAQELGGRCPDTLTAVPSLPRTPFGTLLRRSLWPAWLADLRGKAQVIDRSTGKLRSPSPV